MTDIAGGRRVAVAGLARDRRAVPQLPMAIEPAFVVHRLLACPVCPPGPPRTPAGFRVALSQRHSARTPTPRSRPRRPARSRRQCPLVGEPQVSVGPGRDVERHGAVSGMQRGGELGDLCARRDPPARTGVSRRQALRWTRRCRRAGRDVERNAGVAEPPFCARG